MSKNVAHMDVPPARVFAVLADPESYGHWVVGSQKIRGVEGRWPEPGSRFHHRVGIGPLSVADYTESLEMVPDRRLVLDARAQPFGRARVELDLTPEGGGTRVVMIEEGGDRKSQLLNNPIGHRLLHLRNTESLRRLRRLAEG